MMFIIARYRFRHKEVIIDVTRICHYYIHAHCRAISLAPSSRHAFIYRHALEYGLSFDARFRLLLLHTATPLADAIFASLPPLLTTIDIMPLMPLNMGHACRRTLKAATTPSVYVNPPLTFHYDSLHAAIAVSPLHCRRLRLRRCRGVCKILLLKILEAIRSLPYAAIVTPQ